MGKFSSYSSKPVVSNVLPVGEHRVRIIEAMEIDSITSHNGEKKNELPVWINPTDQFLIHVVSTDNKGSLIHRLQGQAWKKFADLTDDEVKSKKYTNCSGYACITTKNGLERIEDKSGTETCSRIFDRFMNAIGAPEGSGIDYVAQAIANKTELLVTVVNDEYEGKDQFKIKAFKPVPVEVVESNDLEG